MKARKIVSAVMATAIAASAMGISAFAEDDTTSGNVKASGEVKVTGDATFNPVVLDVTMDTAIQARINPYKVSIEITPANTTTGDAAVMSSATGFDSPEYTIENDTVEYGIKVAAKASMTAGSGITVIEAADYTKYDANTDTEKSVFGFINTTLTQGIYANAEWNANNKEQLIIETAEADEAKELMEIAKDGGKGYYQINGKSTADPETAWTSSDKVTINITFDIKPFVDDGTGTTPSNTKSITAAVLTCNSSDITGNVVGTNITFTGYTGGALQYGSGTIKLTGDTDGITNLGSSEFTTCTINGDTITISGATSGSVTFDLSDGTTYTIALTAST